MTAVLQPRRKRLSMLMISLAREEEKSRVETQDMSIKSCVY